MIKTLKIRNYALIENLEIDFLTGFITITGETGAGKSILMGALSLILGQRADTSVLLNKDRKCIVEGKFRIGNELKAFFIENDLDFDEETFLRREILPGGKSRAFINDTPVTLTVLKELGDNLVDIHSQHQNLQLGDHSYQLGVVDYVSKNKSDLETYHKQYIEFIQKKSEHRTLKEEIDRISGELDYLNFQFDELDKASLQENEIEELEQEVNQLEHAEEIKLALSGSVEALSGEGNALTLLNEALQLQKKISSVNKGSSEYAGRLESAYIELKDISLDMQGISDSIEYDPDRLNTLKERIDLLYSLQQKHRVKDVADLIRIHEELQIKIDKINFSDDNLRKLEKDIDSLKNELVEMAEELHLKRKEAGRFIESKVAEELAGLGIQNALFIVRSEMLEEPGPAGMSDVRFLFSANKQAPAKEISKVASGGEISRLMLTIKSLLSDYKGLPTIIFDEIDAGVSGEIAEKMGSIMKRMSGGRQVIAITHLPQVASQGEEHFLVFKEDEENSTVTHIRKLSSEERVNEIAKLLSGEKVTAAAISNAKELLKF